MFVTLGSGGKFGSRGERVRCCAGMAPDARLGRAVGAERPMDVAIAGVEAWRGRRVPDPCCCVSEIRNLVAACVARMAVQGRAGRWPVAWQCGSCVWSTMPRAWKPGSGQIVR